MLNQIFLDIRQIILQYFFTNVFVAILAISLVGCLGYRTRKLDWQKAVAWILWIVYLCFVIELTLITREAGSRIGVSLTIWGTYAPDVYAKCWMVENLLLFIPLGILLPVIWKKMQKTGWFCLVAFLGSLCIETIQLITQRGYFQVDDIWLNVLGAVIGFVVYSLIRFFGLRAGICGILFLILWGVIFGFSAQTGEESGGLSDAIAAGFSGMMYQMFGWRIPADRLTYPIRKLAHMTEYALLWLDTFCMAVSGYCYRRKKQLFSGEDVTNRRETPVEHKKEEKSALGVPGIFWMLCMIPVLLVAVGDEIHQLFVPGRAGQLVDVGWDMLGAIICMAFTWLLMHLLSADRAK